MRRLPALLLSAGLCIPALAAEPLTAVPMQEKGTATFYIAARVASTEVEFLVDTGAGYTTLNRDILRRLRQAGVARRTGEIEGVLANGDTCRLSVYRVAAIDLGGGCIVRDVEVAETPAGTRNLLGLSVLRKTAPFTFSLEPPQLHLSHCGSVVARAEAE